VRCHICFDLANFEKGAKHRGPQLPFFLIGGQNRKIGKVTGSKVHFSLDNLVLVCNFVSLDFVGIS
jgi:hypothetical protein